MPLCSSRLLLAVVQGALEVIVAVDLTGRVKDRLPDRPDQTYRRRKTFQVHKRVAAKRTASMGRSF